MYHGTRSPASVHVATDNANPPLHLFTTTSSAVGTATTSPEGGSLWLPPHPLLRAPARPYTFLNSRHSGCRVQVFGKGPGSPRASCFSARARREFPRRLSRSLRASRGHGGGRRAFIASRRAFYYAPRTLLPACNVANASKRYHHGRDLHRGSNRARSTSTRPTSRSRRSRSRPECRNGRRALTRRHRCPTRAYTLGLNAQLAQARRPRVVPWSRLPRLLRPRPRTRAPTRSPTAPSPANGAWRRDSTFPGGVIGAGPVALVSGVDRSRSRPRRRPHARATLARPPCAP